MGGWGEAYWVGCGREGVQHKHSTSLPSNSDNTLLLTFRMSLKIVSFILLPKFHTSFTGSVINLLYSTARHLRFTYMKKKTRLSLVFVCSTRLILVEKNLNYQMLEKLGAAVSV